MANDKDIAASHSFFGELFQVDLYKASQGKIVRQVVFFSLAIIFGVAGWRLRDQFGFDSMSLNGLAVLLGVAGVGAWISYRLVNYPPLADFFISVEGELGKISWPSQQELIRSAIVVILTMVFLALLLWLFDAVWRQLFIFIGIIPSK
jgi:preprotein translocase subunit SecE